MKPRRKRTNLIVLIFTLLIPTAGFGKGIVFCYHKVGYSIDDIYTTIPEMLYHQIKLMKKLGLEIVGIDHFTNTKVTSKHVASITFDDGWRIPKRTIDFLKREKVKAAFFIYPLVIGGNNFFSWDEIRQLSSEGFIIGSHGFSHRLLKDLPEDSLEKEIIYSKEYIEEKIGKEVFAFAYPFGIADRNAQSLSAKTYELSFSVRDEPVRLSKRFNIPRYIIFNHTTLGQLKEIIGSVFGKSNLDYRVYYTESDVKGLYAKLYHYPVVTPEASVLVIPSMSVGPAWFKPVIDRLREFNIEVSVFASEIYSFPFYKYEAYYKNMKEISLETICKSLTKFLNLTKHKRIKIITWGDGLDTVLYLFQKLHPTNVTKIISLNPSILGEKSIKGIKSNIETYEKLISRGKYDLESFRENVKTSVLLNMAFLLPNSQTPFKKNFGTINNTQALIEHIKNNINLKITHPLPPLEEYIEKIQMSPFYTFPVIEPVSYYLGINQFWLEMLTKTKFSNPPEIIIFYNQYYKDNLIPLRSLIGRFDEKYYNLSTLEMFFSEEIAEKIITEVRN